MTAPEIKAPEAVTITQVLSRRPDVTIPVTHHRLITGGVAEQAGVVVSRPALANFSLAANAGLEMHIRQQPISATSKPTEAILVTLETKAGKRMREQLCANMAGEGGTQRTVEKMLAGLSAEEITAWTAKQ